MFSYNGSIRIKLEWLIDSSSCFWRLDDYLKVCNDKFIWCTWLKYTINIHSVTEPGLRSAFDHRTQRTVRYSISSNYININYDANRISFFSKLILINTYVLWLWRSEFLSFIFTYRISYVLTVLFDFFSCQFKFNPWFYTEFFTTRP